MTDLQRIEALKAALAGLLALAEQEIADAEYVEQVIRARQVLAQDAAIDMHRIALGGGQ